MIEIKTVADLLLGTNLRGDGAAEKSRELTLALLKASSAPFSRDQYSPGQITCSGLVLSPGSGSVLVVLHKGLLRWLPPGGHVEPDDSEIAAAARREVIEETGIALREDVPPLLVGVDVHPIPARRGEPFHLHHDLMFRFQAQTVEGKPSKEVQRLAWSAAGEFDRYQLPASIHRAYVRATKARG